jgi:hypothetical protein
VSLRFILIISLIISSANVALADTATLDGTVIKEQRPDGSYIWKLTAKKMVLEASLIQMKDSFIEIFGDDGGRTAVIESLSGSYDSSNKVIILNDNKINLPERKVSITSSYMKVDTANRVFRAKNAVLYDLDAPQNVMSSREVSSGFSLNYFTHKGFEMRTALPVAE